MGDHGPITEPWWWVRAVGGLGQSRHLSRLRQGAAYIGSHPRGQPDRSWRCHRADSERSGAGVPYPGHTEMFAA
jgi:hypothetical protein